jgi:hypothetical protein
MIIFLILTMVINLLISVTITAIAHKGDYKLWPQRLEIEK